MATLIDKIEGSRVEHHRPWPRLVVSERGWRLVVDQLVAGFRDSRHFDRVARLTHQVCEGEEAASA